ncbi:MAG: NADH-quinone oxidoreductase subunit C [Nitrospirota bacterium]|nr:NADH-quinone oxidoreductase subunit C [Nitrospirota bacterium]
MEPLEITERIKERFPDEVLDVIEFREQLAVVIKKERIVELCRWLHDEPDLGFDYLKDICGVDYLGKKPVRFEVVYTLYSLRHRHMLRLKAAVSEDAAYIDSVVPVWIGANWHERECYDMYGIRFNGHPDLSRVLMPEDWEGHPLRKDYPEGGPEREWQGFQEVLDKAQKLKEFSWKG